MISIRISDKGKKWFYLKILKDSKVLDDLKFTDFDELKGYLIRKANLLIVR
jgi:hypothetical protein